MQTVRFERWSRNVLACLVGLFWPVQKIPPEAVRQEFSEKRIRKILLIRPHQGLGDLLLATPIFRALKDSPQRPQLHFLADTYNRIAIERNPRLDKVWFWDKRKMVWPWRLWAFLRRLRAERFDLAIVISSHIPSFTSFVIARLSGARIVWGYTTPPFYNGANWSRHLAHVELDAPSPEVPEYVKFIGLVRPLGVESSFEPEFYVTLEEKEWAKARWREFTFAPDDRVVGLFLGGNPDRPARLWSAAEWVQLAKGLAQEKRLRLMAVVPPWGLRSGSKAREPGCYEEFSAALGSRLPVFFDSSLSRVAALLQRLDLFVCPDGGLFHIAIAAHVPTIGLFFETDPEGWVPPVPWVKGLRGAAGRLSPDAVLQTAREFLAPSHDRFPLAVDKMR
jgi:ADP-heptose:LPS heptosyltransferase